MDNNTENNVSKRRDCSGQNNGFYGKSHSMESRNKMSQSHKAYQQRIRDNQSNNSHNRNYVMQPMSMQDFLSNHPSVEDYLKQLAKKVVKEQIDKLIWNCQKRISIPNI